MSKHSGGNPYPRPLSSLTPAIHGLVSGAVIGAQLGLRDFFTQSTRQNQGTTKSLPTSSEVAGGIALAQRPGRSKGIES